MGVPKFRRFCAPGGKMSESINQDANQADNQSANQSANQADNQSTKSYKCKSCGAPLRWDAEQGLLLCDHCDSTFDPEVFESEDKGNKEAEYDWSINQDDESRETIENTRTYKCKSCGAEIVTDSTTIASKCPYCDNVLVMEPGISGILKPNAIIPFKIAQKDLKPIVKEFYSGKILLPSNFIKKSNIEEIKGMYVPFWLFDTLADGNITFDGTKVRTWHDSKYNYTETKHYDVYREGSMRFEKVPVDGSKKMDDGLMDSVEPYDYKKLVDFDPAYFSGFLADRFDENVEESLPRATKRVRASVVQTFGETAKYDTLTEKSGQVKMLDTSVKYALLPVYLIHAKYSGKDYHFAVNGQTGKIVGNLPISPIKQALIFLLVTLLVAGLSWGAMLLLV